MSQPSVFAWRDGALVPESGLPDARDVAVADSFRVDEGAALALGVHRARFCDSVAVARPELTHQVEAFWEAAIAELPRTGSISPRVELSSIGDEVPRLRLFVRPAPSPVDTIRVTTASHDPRLVPAVKGPDLARLEALRTEAQGAGADEAVILSADGSVVEGNYTSLVWWRGDALCIVADDVPRLPGVTEKSLVTLAAALGVEVLPDEVLPAELDGLEVWALNSLQGIRIVTHWEGGPSLAEQPGRLRLWRTRLDALRRPLPDRRPTLVS